MGFGQAYNDGYPTVKNIDLTTVTVVTNVTVNNFYTSFIILEEGVSAPTVQNVMDWTYDGNGGTLTIGTYGDIAIPARNGAGNEFSFNAYNLSPGTNYIVYCVSSSDFTTATSIEQTSPTTIPFTTNIYIPEITWLGGESSDWTDNNNWSQAYEKNANITIPGDVTFHAALTGTDTINNLTILAGGQMIISSGSSLHILGDLILNSTATDNADLATMGDITFEPTAQVYIYQKISSSNRSYFISCPVENLTFGDIGTNLNKYYWDNNTGTWGTCSDATSLEIGKGYVVDGTVQNLLFNGQIYTNDLFLTLNQGSSDGWNLIGNPYSSAINFDQVILSNQMEESYNIYLNISSAYGSYNSALGSGTNGVTKEIPSNHAFWVRVTPTETSGTLTFTNACKSIFDNSYLKAAAPVYPQLKLAGVNSTYKDEMIIAFNDAEEITDPTRFNTTKYFSSTTNYAELFISDGNSKRSIYGVSSLKQDDAIVPLSIKIPSDGTFSIERISLSNFDENVEIYLEDLEDINNPIVTDLRLVKTYSFTATSGTIANRFQIRFIPGISTNINDEDFEKSKVNIYGNKNAISIVNLDSKQNLISIYTITGELISEEHTKSSSYSKAITSSGIYIVKIKSDLHELTRKVFVK